jgi:hypothetical protein
VRVTTWRELGVVVGLAILGGAGAAAAATSGGAASAGTLNLRAELRVVSTLGACPPGMEVTACAARPGDGVVPGLGQVTQTYTFLAHVGPPTCAAADFGKALAYPVRLVVAGKGEIHLAVSEGTQCVFMEEVRTQTQAFTVTSGTGAYAGASGSGTVERSLPVQTATGRTGREIWSAALTVPGLEFDLAPPTLSGAVAKRVLAPRRAKRVRVTYAVTARDDVDGTIAVSCTPRSGSRFRVGRTRVTCTATDTSGNSATAAFTVTVRARR